ncbi:MAG TPA: 2-amino-4-hydroxy-6-hydroxymethyldihydropteridine diphosphokinase [Vicinamibacterales bacterium]|nr:2-amino-4-hydroxy-6-hydroxymethyldihydropteridine diphosphokinase [Vicinamibacterales bacterium]
MASSPAHAGSATDPVRVAIALGSNLGDREGTLTAAAAQLAALLDRFTLSSRHDTAPVGVSGPQPRYLNAAGIGFTRLGPRELLARLHDIERAFGRERSVANASRTLDLDLIFYGELVLSEPGLTIPHPRFRDRSFVLAPLAEVGPDMVDPVTGRTVRELEAALGR